MEKIERDKVFQKLFQASYYGNLGMFIGAGFSKAITREPNRAMSWMEIIVAACQKFAIEIPENEQLIGMSLPELATLVCNQIATKKGVSYEDAKTRFKQEISNQSNWLPDKEEQDSFREYFDSLDPAWIITTNYDLVIETIMTGKSIGLSPMSYISSPRDIVPVYHLHGIRLEPESIIITQDDYIRLFRPNEYRQAKLAMTIRESTTLVLGYGLGDINVLSAVDWSKNVYTEETDYPHDIIQALWTTEPKEYAYKDENNNLIIEIEDLQSFLDELMKYINKEKEEADEKLGTLKQLVEKLTENNGNLMESFIKDKDMRRTLLQAVAYSEYLMIRPYIQFLETCLDKVWDATNMNGAFHKYREYLDMVLDILEFYDPEIGPIPPRLFQVTIEALNKVLLYVDESVDQRTYGNSWQATESWHSRKDDIPEVTMAQIVPYADKNQLHALKRLVQSTPEEVTSIGIE